jgi:hypothetical protein
LLGKTDPRCQSMTVVLDAGLWVDRSNVEQVLAQQDKREQAANAQPNKYAEVVEKAIAQGSENLTSASR